MLSAFIKPAPMIFALATVFSVLLHDTQVDKATVTALAPVITVSGYSAMAVPELRSEQHTHSEFVSESLKNLTSGQPRLQSRFTDEKKYLSPKKIALNLTTDLLT